MRHWKNFVLGTVAVLASLLLTAGCASRLPEQKIAVYDLGAPPIQSLHQSDASGNPPQQVLLMPTVQAARTLQQTDVVYRLDYHDALQPKSYALARWRSPPAELIEQRIRQQLSVVWSVVNSQTQLQLTPDMRMVHVVVDEFSHVFATPQQSSAWLQVRVTVTAPQHNGARLIGQRSFTIRQPSVSPDAAGGVHAMRATVDTLVQQLDAWLRTLSTQQD